MMRSDIGQLLYRKFLRRVSWNVFDHVVLISFGDGATESQITFRGVYGVVSRQQNDVSVKANFGADCEIQYAAITTDSEFLQRFVSNRLGLETESFVYDDNGRTFEDPDYDFPHHFSLSCDAGNLDIVFRECNLQH